MSQHANTRIWHHESPTCKGKKASESEKEGTSDGRAEPTLDPAAVCPTLIADVKIGLFDTSLRGQQSGNRALSDECAYSTISARSCLAFLINALSRENAATASLAKGRKEREQWRAAGRLNPNVWLRKRSGRRQHNSGRQPGKLRRSCQNVLKQEKGHENDSLIASQTFCTGIIT